MSEEKKTVELKDEDLEKVTGGWRIDPPDCSSFSLDPKRDKSEEAMKYNLTMSYNCKDCIHFHGPEGPCEFNLPIKM